MGLRQPTYVMKRIEKGNPLVDIIDDIESDQQLVKMWLAFLQANKWIEKPNSKWIITEKGKGKLKKYDSQSWADCYSLEHELYGMPPVVEARK